MELELFMNVVRGFYGFKPMFPLIFFKCLWAHKISFVQHLTIINLYVERV